MIAPNKVPLSEVVKSLVIRTKDKTGLSYADYMSFARDIWVEMNMSAIKDTKRVVIQVNRKHNSIALPEDFIQFSSISIFREGKIVPLVTNSELSEKIIDLSAHKYCECGSDLCANLSNYELIEEPIEIEMPDGQLQVFTKSIRRKVKADGSWVTEVSEPVKKYLAGVFTAVEMETREEYLCELDLSEGGCVKQTEQNRTKIYSFCGFHDLRHECGCPSLAQECLEQLGYKINASGRRIILPANHSYDHVIVRGYYQAKTKDILIPQVARKNMMDRLYFAGIEYDPKVPKYRRDEAKSAIVRSQTNMASDLSRMTISDLYHTISPLRIL